MVAAVVAAVIVVGDSPAAAAVVDITVAIFGTLTIASSLLVSPFSTVIESKLMVGVSNDRISIAFPS